MESVTAFLSVGPGLAPLAILTNEAAADLDGAFERFRDRLQQPDVPRNVVEVLFGAAFRRDFHNRSEPTRRECDSASSARPRRPRRGAEADQAEDGAEHQGDVMVAEGFEGAYAKPVGTHCHGRSKEGEGAVHLAAIEERRQ